MATKGGHQCANQSSNANSTSPSYHYYYYWPICPDLVKTNDINKLVEAFFDKNDVTQMCLRT